MCHPACQFSRAVSCVVRTLLGRFVSNSLGLLTELWECTDLLGQFILHEECRNGVEDRGLLNDTVVREEIPGLSEYEQTEADYKSFVNRNISGHLSCVFEVSITEFLSSIGRI